MFYCSADCRTSQSAGFNTVQSLRCGTCRSRGRGQSVRVGRGAWPQQVGRSRRSPPEAIDPRATFDLRHAVRRPETVTSYETVTQPACRHSTGRGSLDACAGRRRSVFRPRLRVWSDVTSVSGGHADTRGAAPDSTAELSSGGAVIRCLHVSVTDMTGHLSPIPSTGVSAGD